MKNDALLKFADLLERKDQEIQSLKDSLAATSRILSDSIDDQDNLWRENLLLQKRNRLHSIATFVLAWSTVVMWVALWMQ